MIYQEYGSPDVFRKVVLDKPVPKRSEDFLIDNGCIKYFDDLTELELYEL